MGGEQGTRMPTINISDIRKARGIRGDRLYDSDVVEIDGHRTRAVGP
jgi:hypothetical protein